MILLSDSDNIVLIPVKIPGENFHSLDRNLQSLNR
jgi:hypothetical protein